MRAANGAGYRSAPIASTTSSQPERVEKFERRGGSIRSDALEIVYGVNGQVRFVRRIVETTGPRPEFARARLRATIRRDFGVPVLNLDQVAGNADFFFYRGPGAAPGCRAFPLNAFNVLEPPATPLSFDGQGAACRSGMGVELLFAPEMREQPILLMIWALWDENLGSPPQLSSAPGVAWQAIGRRGSEAAYAVSRENRDVLLSLECLVLDGYDDKATLHIRLGVRGTSRETLSRRLFADREWQAVARRPDVIVRSGEGNFTIRPTGLVGEIMLGGVQGIAMHGVGGEISLNDLNRLSSAKTILTDSPAGRFTFETTGLRTTSETLPCARPEGAGPPPDRPETSNLPQGRFYALSSTAMAITGDLTVNGYQLNFSKGQRLIVTPDGAMRGDSEAFGPERGLLLPVYAIRDFSRPRGAQTFCGNASPTHIAIIRQRNRGIFLALFQQKPTATGNQEGRLCGTFSYLPLSR